MGQVSEMLVDEGSRVRRGQVLARIGDEQSQTQLRLAQAQHTAALARQQSAEAQLREARREREREQTLRDQNFTSEARLSKAQTALETATANLATARADVDLARLQVVRQEQVLDDFIVRAPFDGVVMARNAQLGEIVAPGGAGGGYTRTGILTIVDMGSLEIVVDVNEDMITRVQPGQPVQAELYSHKGWRIAGEVLRVMPNADRAKSTVRARIKLLTDDPRILPDMAVKVQFL
jgi:RND family efflux transporter MFP subunit